MDPLDQPLAELVGHRLEICTACACTKVVVFGPEYLVTRLKPGATLRTAAEQLKCSVCHQRPTLTIERDYGTGEGRDRRPNPAPLPGWVVPLLVRE